MKLAFKYWSGKSTTYHNEYNPFTRQYSIAGTLHAFLTQKERQNWISKQDLSLPIPLGGGIREAVRLSEARKLLAGLTERQFIELIEILRESITIELIEILEKE